MYHASVAGLTDSAAGISWFGSGSLSVSPR